MFVSRPILRILVAISLSEVVVSMDTDKPEDNKLNPQGPSCSLDHGPGT